MENQRKSIISSEMKKNDLAIEVMQRMVELDYSQ